MPEPKQANVATAADATSDLVNGRPRKPRRMPKQRANVKSEYTGFRFSPDDLKEIDLRAEGNGMTRTQYVTDKALDRIDRVEGPTAIERELSAHARRLQRLEDFAFGGR